MIKIIKFKDAKGILMVFITVVIKMELGLDMEYFNGIMEKGFKVIGRKVLKMDMEFGLPKSMIDMKDNG
jgi:hypothetical protein